MRFASSLLLFLGSVFIGVDGTPYPAHDQTAGNTDSEVIASFSTQGLCFRYLSGVGYNLQKSLAPCVTWCNKADPSHAGEMVCSFLFSPFLLLLLYYSTLKPG